jgi:ADP-ribosylglycohydrolase
MLYADKKGRGYGNEFIQGISQNPSEWSDEQADAMFLSNMMAQTGSDKEIRRIGRGDEQARQDAYYKFHHTAPDEATKRRVNTLMANSNQPVDDTMKSYSQADLSNYLNN